MLVATIPYACLSSFRSKKPAAAPAADACSRPTAKSKRPSSCRWARWRRSKAVSQDILEELGAQIILGNTYHLYLRPGVETVRRLGGLHGFMSWPRAILTDSGGFQVFSLNELRKVTEEGVTFRSHLDGSSHFFSPESAMQAQIGLGADIIMAFDECTEFPADRERMRTSMELTARGRRAARSILRSTSRKCRGGALSCQLSAISQMKAQKLPANSRFLASLGMTTARGIISRKGFRNRKLETGNSTQSLFGIVQGGMDRELRRESAERTIEIGFPGYAIGGLSVGEPRELTREIVESTLEHLPKDKPRYLMGVGTPEEIVEYASLGVDMMDCVLPTRAARHGLAVHLRGQSLDQAGALCPGSRPARPQLRLPGVPALFAGLFAASLCFE